MNTSKILLSSAISMMVLSASNLGLAAAPMLMGSYGAYGPYVGVQAGMGGMDTKKLSDAIKGSKAPYTEDVNDWDFFTGRVFAGYLWSQDALSYGLELGAMMYPKNKYSVTEGSSLVKYQYKGYTVDALGVVKYSLANNFYVFGKAGVAYVTQEYKQETNPTVTVFEKTERKFLPEVAAGVGYDFNNMGVDVTYAHIFGKAPKEYSTAGIAPASDDLYKNVASINALMLSFIYHVGR